MSAEPGRPCANCGAPLPAPPPPFCAQCGQETNTELPRVREFVQHLGGAYISTEGALGRTLKLLLLRPGQLTREYWAGRRKHYVHPLRLLLTASLAMLLAMQLSVSQVDLRRIDVRSGTLQLLSFGPQHQVGVSRGEFVCVGLPGWMCERVRAKLAGDPARAVALVERTLQVITHRGQLAMLPLLPLAALLLQALYRPRRLRFAAHLVFAMHVHAFCALVLTLAMLPLPATQPVAIGVIAIYTWLAMRRSYGGRWWATTLRFAVAYGVYLAMFLASVAVLATAALVI